MRLRHPDGTVVHLGYGTNVLPAEDVDGLVAQVSTYGDRLRARLGVDRIGLGMWLPAAAAERLAADLGEVGRLRRALDEHGVEVVTLNTFPYADFQGAVVKKRVYEPDWAERSRLDYTLAAARVLAALLPDDAARGSMSTLPLGWHSPWPADQQRRAEQHLDELEAGLAKLHADTGRTIRVAVEPEPGCVIETTAQAVERLASVDRDHIGICLDLCHLAVGFEDADSALARLDAAGLDIVKAQPASALVVDDPSDAAARAALSAYSEDRFLHQVRQCDGAQLAERDDLPDALDGSRPLPTDSPWRVHFHVPVYADPAPPLRNSRDDLRASLAALLGGPTARVDHLEIETYTWTVLPGVPDPADADAYADFLADGLAAELAFVRDELVALGLTAIP